MKYSFKNDYGEGAHPRVLENLVKFNDTQEPGYGLDSYSARAKELLQEKIQNSRSEIYFVPGGTLANLLVISSILRPHQAVLSASTGHISTNESFAIEATGHKVCTVETPDGKLTTELIKQALLNHMNIPHQGEIKLVYISNSTELGTVYSISELKEIFSFCKEKDLYLFLDGARLAHAIADPSTSLSLKEVAENTDCFYFGGTKNGVMIGEAIVLNNPAFFEGFAYQLKQRGGMLAKGRLLGIQFLTLLEDDLYLELATYANTQALEIKRAFLNKGFPMLSGTFTNQIFPILPQKAIEKLSESFDFYIWKKIDEKHSAIRIITSWATPKEVTQDFINTIKSL